MHSFEPPAQDERERPVGHILSGLALRFGITVMYRPTSQLENVAGLTTMQDEGLSAAGGRP
jgi:hypothetical protein